MVNPDLVSFWHFLAAALALVLMGATSGHAILYRRETRATVAWVGLIWLAPLAGSLLYLLFGINRIRRKATRLLTDRERVAPAPGLPACAPEDLAALLPPSARHLAQLAGFVERCVARPLLGGNRITPLPDGDAAYPAMLEAIEAAQRSVALSTYIFDNDGVGGMFLEALRRAVKRQVEVRVLIDDVGARYSWTSMERALRRDGIPVALFMPTLFHWRIPYLNLRNHRKILVADGRVGFVGGMNIRDAHWVGRGPRHPVQDLHARVEGPVVAHLRETFAEDWSFTTGETLSGEAWFPALSPAGETPARGIADGPDEDRDKMRWTYLGALSHARRSVVIVTPYFLPDDALITALGVAATSGVEVAILLPARNNQPLVQWASRALWWQVLERGCRIFLTPPPFDHSKLLLVDESWVLFGSANWDPRSLRLNFEFGVECYDGAVAGRFRAIAERKRAGAREVTLAEADARRIPTRLRDGIARLFSPYL